MLHSPGPGICRPIGTSYTKQTKGPDNFETPEFLIAHKIINFLRRLQLFTRVGDILTKELFTAIIEFPETSDVSQNHPVQN